MYNLRYHIITIVAIFLALTIGIVMGAAIGGSEALRQTSSSLVTSLQSDYKEALAQKDKIQKELTAKRNFTQMFIDGWAQDILENKHVIVVSDKGSQTAYEEVQRLVEQAGANCTRAVITPTDFTDAKNAELAQKLMTALGVSKPEAIQKELSKALVREWSLGQYGQEMQVKSPSGALGVIGSILPGSSSESSSLAQEEASETEQVQTKIHGEVSAILLEAGILSFTNLPEQAPDMNYLVNISVEGEDHKTMSWGLDLAQQALSAGIYALSTQLSNADDNLVVDAQTRGFSAVAALDSQVGGYNMLALLASEQTGVFGLDGTKAYPDLPNKSMRQTGADVLAPSSETSTVSAQSQDTSEE